MVRRLLVILSVLSLVLPTAVLAQGPSPLDRFQANPSKQPIDPAVLPVGLDDSRSVTVMVQLEGDPVAVVQAEKNRKLTKAERKAIKAQLKARQDAIKDDIAGHGGRVMSQLQSAYNGMRVEISRSEVPSLASLPNVIGVRGLQVQRIDNATSVPFLGVPSVWQNTGFTGANIKVGVIDTGIDYTHANFGGPGTPEAYQEADANDTEATSAEAFNAFFGPDAPKVKGGWDFVGDAYDADADAGTPAATPQPDADPLDCQGHGSHVSGTVGGFGVLDDGTQYTGPYDETTHTNDFRIGPGVAPEVDLYALRVFGCAGSTNVTVEAIDWAVDNDLDVINMSLGAPWGRATDPSAVASTNAAAAGVIVVASAGNEGPNPYITGAPAAGAGAISVAAVDSTATFPGATMALSTGATLSALNANGADLPTEPLEVYVLRDADGEISLGCDPQEYIDQDVAGKLVVTVRGTCARVARAVFGQQAGAAAVVMINTDAGYPPFEGPITGNPDPEGPADFPVSIPFLGVRGVLGSDPTDDGDTLIEADGGTVTLAAAPIENPGFRGFAGFSSSGPRNGDSGVKPNVSAPGVSIQSTAVGTGNQGERLSGTSMASPHVAGVAALVRQAHPDWTTEDLTAVIQNYADPSGVAGYRLSLGGTGLVDTAESVAASVVALGDSAPAEDQEGNPTEFMTASLSFGFAELAGDFSGTRTLTVRNHGTSAVTLDLGNEPSPQSVDASVSFSPSSVNVPAGGSATVEVTLNVAASAVGTSTGTADQFSFFEASGNVTLSSGETVLRVPYLLAPRALSDIDTTLAGKLNPRAKGIEAVVTNDDGVLPASADFYTWGLSDPDDMDEAALGGSGYDVRAVGVQSFDVGGGEQLVVFAINNHSRWSTASVNEWDINVDTNGDGAPDAILFAVDSGLVRTGVPDGLVEVFLFIPGVGTFVTGFFATSPTDSSTLLVPTLASFIGLSEGDGDFTYTVESFSLEGAGDDVVDGVASYNPWNKALADGQFAEVAPGGDESVNVAINASAFAHQQPLGIMVVALDNAAGAAEAQLISPHVTPGRRP